MIELKEYNTIEKKKAFIKKYEMFNVKEDPELMELEIAGAARNGFNVDALVEALDNNIMEMYYSENISIQWTKGRPEFDGSPLGPMRLIPSDWVLESNNLGLFLNHLIEIIATPWLKAQLGLPTGEISVEQTEAYFME